MGEKFQEITIRQNQPEGITITSSVFKNDGKIPTEELIGVFKSSKDAKKQITLHHTGLTAISVAGIIPTAAYSFFSGISGGFDALEHIGQESFGQSASRFLVGAAVFIISCLAENRILDSAEKLANAENAVHTANKTGEYPHYQVFNFRNDKIIDIGRQ